MPEQVTMTFEWNEWNDIIFALGMTRDQLERTEQERTGGRGFASGGKAETVGRLESLRNRVAANLRRRAAER